MSSDQLDAAAALVDAGDLAGALRTLRPVADQTPPAELAEVVGRAAAAAGFDDVAAAARNLIEQPDDPERLYAFGYGCIERGVHYLAVGALRRALEAAPQERNHLVRLVVAYERGERHAEAVEVLARYPDRIRRRPEGFQYVFNSLLAGDVARAERAYAELEPAAAGGAAEAGDERLRGMLARVAAARPVTPLDRTDLRGWHFVLGGGIVGHLSPFGWDAGMTGRYAYRQDSYAMCRYGLERLRLVLAAVGRTPFTVTVLPDRSSAILGTAAAELFGLPAVSWSAGRPDTLVVAYDLAHVDDKLLGELRDRRAGQVVAEHATNWVTAAPVAADYSTLFHQVNVAPWGERMMMTAPGEAPRVEAADGRPVAELAAEVVNAAPEPEEGDGASPPDPDRALTSFAAAVAAWWAPPSGRRDRLSSPGPVPSGRFG